MNLKHFIMVLLLAVSTASLFAGQSVSFLHDGNIVTDVITDISSRTGQIDYISGLKVHRSRVWMINYENGEWNFPQERSQLSPNADTIFLHTGHVLHVRIVDFSSRRQIYEFQDGGSVHESKIRRIYFCCVNLPPVFQSQIQSQRQQHDNNQRFGVTFLINGDSYQNPISFLNATKCAFVDGPQINTQDIWMINLVDNNWYFPDELDQLGEQEDTIFLKDGEVLHDRVIDFSKTRMTFRFENTNPIPANQINRIYFCCTVLPEAYQSRDRGRRLREPRRRH